MELGVGWFPVEKWLAMAGTKVWHPDPPLSFEEKLAADLRGVCLANCLGLKAKVMLFMEQMFLSNTTFAFPTPS